MSEYVSQSAEEQLNRQLDWCIEQLESGMRNQKSTQKESTTFTFFHNIWPVRKNMLGCDCSDSNPMFSPHRGGSVSFPEDST